PLWRQAARRPVGALLECVISCAQRQWAAISNREDATEVQKLFPRRIYSQRKPVDHSLYGQLKKIRPGSAEKSQRREHDAAETIRVWHKLSSVRYATDQLSLETISFVTRSPASPSSDGAKLARNCQYAGSRPRVLESSRSMALTASSPLPTIGPGACRSKSK